MTGDYICSGLLNHTLFKFFYREILEFYKKLAGFYSPEEFLLPLTGVRISSLELNGAIVQVDILVSAFLP
jgi:hypothetical protein